MILRADEINYNEDTGDVEARGNIEFEHFAEGEKLQADHAEYNVDDETGKFYVVTGTSPAKIQARPGLLTTSNPFYFQGKWAERLKDHYILHEGFVTDCKVPKPWWTLKAPVFDVIPGDRAIARRAVFRLRHFPLFYTPYFYKSLKRNPRRSGLLTPNVGNSSLRGRWFGLGYYWAINRSSDLLYVADIFTAGAVAHHVDMRWKLRSDTDFSIDFFGVNDAGTSSGANTTSASGYLLTLRGKSNLGKGWTALGELNYLSSFAFRQQFSQTFHEAIFSESHSTGFITKHWSDYGFYLVGDRSENFQSTAPDDKIVIRKLPDVEFLTRDHQVRNLPLWVSLDSDAGLLQRTQPLFQTRQFVERLDFAPEVTTALHWKDIELIPSFGIRETYYGSSFVNGQVTGNNLLRSARDVKVDLVLPSLARVFKPPSWLGEKLKHVIEPRVTYRFVDGIQDFNRIIRFDDTELMTNTNQVEFSLTNRLYTKKKDGRVDEFLSWQLWYARYFDPTFGGAVVAGQRNVIQSTADLTGFTFLDQPRNSSPVVSALRLQSKVGIEWRTDYDPLRHRIVNSTVSVDARWSKYFVSLGNTQVHSDPVLSPSANQFRGLIGFGNNNRRGWNAAFSANYDYRQQILQFSQTEVTYNTDCCGFSVQFRRFSLPSRSENQFLVSFAISNIGTFGTLKRQERIF